MPRKKLAGAYAKKNAKNMECPWCGDMCEKTLKDTKEPGGAGVDMARMRK
mgnify:CR=1 FL=1